MFQWLESLVQEMTQGLQNFGTGAYLLVFVIVLLETVVVLGQFVPGSVFLALVGFLCFARIFDFTGMLLSVYSAHFLGEQLNYMLGRTKGRELFKDSSRFFKPRFLEMAESRFQESGIKMLVVGQFLGFLRPFLSLVAGATHYPLRWFIPVTAFSTFLWALVHLGIGFLCGASWQRAVDYLEGLALTVIVVVVAGILASWAMRWVARLLAELGRLAERSAVRLKETAWYCRMAGLHPPMFRFIERRLSFATAWGFGATLGFLTAFGFICVSLVILAQIISGTTWQHLDLSVLNLLAQLRRPLADSVFLVITHLGSAKVIWAVVVIAALLSAQARQYKSCLVIVGSVLMSVFLSQLLKFGYGRERPDITIRMVSAVGYSFPSGHSSVAFAFFGALYYWLWNHPGILRLRVFLAFVVVLLSLLIGFSRMYLGVHYPSDVVAGYSLGLASVVFCATVASNWTSLPDVPRRADWAVLLTVAVQIAAATAYAKYHPIKPPPEYVEKVSAREFADLSQMLKAVPLSTDTFDGRKQLPITVVGLGQDDVLTSHLQSIGWSPVRASDFFTRQLSTPVFPSFVDARPAKLTLEKRTSETRLIFREWKLPHRIGDKSVWLATVTKERMQKRWREFRIFRIDPDQDLSLEQFRDQITTAPVTVQPLPKLRRRGLFSWNNQFFTHGDGLLISAE